ncbi:MAG: hypothetical protein OQK24_12720 [Magnetovibrio sp.]|nr:hypothetical protein [Magnetovibrio sp.]
MKLYSPGDTGKAVCEDCGDIVSMTFQYRDVPFSDGSGLAHNILVGVCDSCDSVIAIPPQSTPAIKAARKVAAKSIEAKVPSLYIEALDLASYRISPSLPREFKNKLVMYFVHQCATDEKMAKAVSRKLEAKKQTFEKSIAPHVLKRFSMKVSPDMAADFDKAMDMTNLNKTSLIKSVVLQINDDIIRPNRPKKMEELKHFAAASAG